MTDTITLDRQRLRMGKYTRAYADLTSDQLVGLLWLLGEWSGRAQEDGSLIGNKSRATEAIAALRLFHRYPLTDEEAKALMRDAGRPLRERVHEPFRDAMLKHGRGMFPNMVTNEAGQLVEDDWVPEEDR
jgi:hypothetical protein